jgi:hypothetical protein
MRCLIPRCCRPDAEPCGPHVALQSLKILTIKIHRLHRSLAGRWLLESFAVVLKRSGKKPCDLLLTFQACCSKVVFVVVNMVSLYLIYSYYHLIPLLQDSKRHEGKGRMDEFAGVTCKLFSELCRPNQTFCWTFGNSNPQSWLFLDFSLVCSECFMASCVAWYLSRLRSLTNRQKDVHGFSWPLTFRFWQLPQRSDSDCRL